MSELPEELQNISPAGVRELDVRPILDAGDKPFDAIMDAAETVPQKGALKLITSFKPAPLISVLEREGWSHHIARAPEGHWNTWFFRA